MSSPMASRSIFPAVLLLGSMCAGVDARTTDTLPARNTPASAQEKDMKPKGTKTKGAQPKGTRTGLASYYGKGLQGRKTASGEVFDKMQMVAAHPYYPLGTRVKVTNLGNGRSEELRVIDRGPAPEHRYEGVIIDVSEAAATRLGFRKKGRTRVKVEVLEWGKKDDK